MAFSIPVGCKFIPNDEQLVGYFLFNKLCVQTSPLHDLQKLFLKDFDIYGLLEPWEIWQQNGGDHLEADQALYFFTQLKKVGVNGSRICRRVGKGTWAGQDSGDEITVGNVVGSKKRFRYQNKHSPDDGAWIMHEFAIHSVPLEPQLKVDDWVLCRMKQNPRAPHNKRKLNYANFEQSRCCAISMTNLNPCSDTALIVQTSEPEVEDPNLMFDPEELLLTLEGELYNMVKVQGNIFQHSMTTIKADADHNQVDMEHGLPPSTVISSTPHDFGVGDDVMRDRPLMRDRGGEMPNTDAEDRKNVGGGDCSWADKMKDIPLPPDDMIAIPGDNMDISLPLDDMIAILGDNIPSINDFGFWDLESPSQSLD